jgi:hypothetical protein
MIADRTELRFRLRFWQVSAGGHSPVQSTILFIPHVLEMFRRTLPNSTFRPRLDRFWITKILREAQARSTLKLSRDWPLMPTTRPKSLLPAPTDES